MLDRIALSFPADLKAIKHDEHTAKGGHVKFSVLLIFSVVQMFAKNGHLSGKLSPQLSSFQ